MKFTMRPTTFVTYLFVLCFCWLAGVEIGIAKTNYNTVQQEKPYRKVMQEAVDGLNKSGLMVAMPDALPALYKCSECLAAREAFGAYVAETNQVIMPDDFDVMTPDGHSTLIHEYGHFLMTKAGIPEAEQEPRCVMLGNSVMQKFFQIVLDERQLDDR